MPHTGPDSGNMDSVRSYCLTREEIRRAGDYASADRMRDTLQGLGMGAAITNSCGFSGTSS